jgi:heptosyltransferase II
MSKILIVGPAWVGDMVMAQSLFKALKQADTSVVIDVLAPDWTRPLLDRMPEVQKAHALTMGHGVLGLPERYRIAKILEKENYGQAIVLTNSWKSALIPAWAKIPKRSGFLGEARFGLLNDYRILHKQQLPLLVDRFVSLAFEKNTPASEIQNIASTVHPRLEIRSDSVSASVEKFALQEIIQQPILALCPGAEFGASKRWPVEHYAAVAKAKQREGWSIWLLGSQKDQAIAANIQALLEQPLVDLSGRTHLSEAIDLLSLAKMVLTNDSGLMHIAAALEKPLLAVYGSTDPGFTPPLGTSAQVLRLGLSCSPCFKRECPLGHHRCMQDLEPQKVLTAMKASGF